MATGAGAGAADLERGPERPRRRTLRRRLLEQLEPALWDRPGLSPVNAVVLAAVVACLTVSVLETEPLLKQAWSPVMVYAEISFALFFATEYALRLWVAGEDRHYRGWRGRLRWMVSPMALIDLMAFLPSLLFLGTSDAFLLRMLWVVRLLRLSKLGRYSMALILLVLTVRRTWRAMSVTLMIALGILLISASLLWLAERQAQPEAFGSIPRALWWSVVTLTTVGYGDVYPITLVGRLLGAVVALMGIGTIALPAGILSAGFAESSQVLAKKKGLILRVRKRRHDRRFADHYAEPPPG